MISIARKSVFALLAFGVAALCPQLSRADWQQTWYSQYHDHPPVVQHYGWAQPPNFAPSAPYRINERWSGSRKHQRYKFEAKYPGGLEYEYRVDCDRDGYRVREKWDD